MGGRRTVDCGEDYADGVVLIDPITGNPFGGSTALPTQQQVIPTEWTVTGFGTQTEVTATKAGVTGQKHYVTGFDASYESTLANGLLVTIERTGGAIIYRAIVTTQRVISFSNPIEIPVGESVTLRVPNGGLSIDGAATLLGYTRA